LISFFTFSLYSQQCCSFSSEIVNLYSCLEGYTGYESSARAQNIVSEILKKSGIQGANFKIKTCDDTNNAVAIIWKNERYIILDEKFLALQSKTDEYWFNIFVTAHEIAHHLYGHTFENNNTIHLESRRNRELESDKYAGLIIRKLGGNEQNIRNALNSIPHPTYNNSTHPIYSDRLKASISGYNSEIDFEKEILNKYNVISERDYLIIQKNRQITEAKKESFNYLLNGKRMHLDNSIEFYHAAIVNNNDSDLYNELSALYGEQGDYLNAEKYINKAYSINPIKEYLISGWNYCILENSHDCSTYFEKLNGIEVTELNDPFLLKTLASFYINTIDQKQQNYENFNLEKSNKAISKAIEILESKHNIFKKDKILLANTYSDFSLMKLRVNDFQEAYTYNKLALTNISKIEELDDFEINNVSAMLYNKALIELRLKMWNDCINSSNKLYEFNSNYQNVIDGGVNYFKGRSYKGLKEFNLSIDEYNKAIKLSKNDVGYLYYYRGLSHFAIDEKDKACIDFQISCDKGLDEGCSKFKLICK